MKWKIPGSDPSWFASWTKPDDVDEKKHWDTFLVLSQYISLWRESNALSISAVKFEYNLFSIDLCPEKACLRSQAKVYASEAPLETWWQQTFLQQPPWKHFRIPLECVLLRIGAECFSSSWTSSASVEFDCDCSSMWVSWQCTHSPVSQWQTHTL